ncbi:MAG: phosphate ABC transporter permease family protein [Proteobacteria bacterium]|nr:phosphate ABC transporter permease family protein [Pseudomonadota bacterium]
MNVFALLFVVVGLGLIGWLTARARAVRFDRGGQKRLHSLPSQHGWYVAMWTVLPALLFVAAWTALSPALIKDQVLARMDFRGKRGRFVHEWYKYACLHGRANGTLEIMF